MLARSPSHYKKRIRDLESERFMMEREVVHLESINVALVDEGNEFEDRLKDVRRAINRTVQGRSNVEHRGTLGLAAEDGRDGSRQF